MDVQHSPSIPLGDEAGLALRIVQAAPGRDIHAEEDLYRLLAPRARLYGLKHLRDTQAAADLAQDVMLMTIDRLRCGQIREPEQIASFVLGTCRRMAIDRKRSVQRRQRILDAHAHNLEDVDSEDSPALDRQQLQRCLSLLPERERSVIVMTFFEDSAASEVAQALGISPANARVIRHRAVERLRICIERGGLRDA